MFEIVKFYLIHDQFQMVMRLCFNFYHFELLPMLNLSCVYTIYKNLEVFIAVCGSTRV